MYFNIEQEQEVFIPHDVNLYTVDPITGTVLKVKEKKESVVVKVLPYRDDDCEAVRMRYVHIEYQNVDYYVLKDYAHKNTEEIRNRKLRGSKPALP